MTTPENNRVVLLAGATGLVGGQLLQLLLNDPGVLCIHALSRKPLRLSHPKLQVHLVDFTSLPQTVPVNKGIAILSSDQLIKLGTGPG